jgi:hypothetical protein
MASLLMIGCLRSSKTPSLSTPKHQIRIAGTRKAGRQQEASVRKAHHSLPEDDPVARIRNKLPVTLGVEPEARQEGSLGSRRDEDRTVLGVFEVPDGDLLADVGRCTDDTCCRLS